MNRESSWPRRLAAGLLLLAVELLGASGMQAQRGGLAAQVNLADLVERAGSIVRGHVVRARVEPHPEFTHLQTVVVTLRVAETLKGESEPVFTFRQFIWDPRHPDQAAGYQKGQELLLFLTRPSRVGLASPVGLAQGRFRIRRDAARNEFAVNAANNLGLFRDLRPALAARGIALSADEARLLETHPGGPVPLAELRDFVRLLAGTE
ncbi:MAG: hypothetical protein HY656_00190 [Acidobacteria bacterium]|nr:hypothetical protein [Acidobacteriota bacterium]